MLPNANILYVVKFVCGICIALGLLLLTVGIFRNDFNYFSSIGIGVIIAAIFIFLIGIFFTVTEEMLEKRNKGIRVEPMKK